MQEIAEKHLSGMSEETSDMSAAGMIKQLEAQAAAAAEDEKQQTRNG